jgi:hypothetical protein
VEHVKKRSSEIQRNWYSMLGSSEYLLFLKGKVGVIKTKIVINEFMI